MDGGWRQAWRDWWRPLVARRLLRAARLAHGNQWPLRCAALCEEALALGELPVATAAELRFLRGLARQALGEPATAEAEWTTVIDLHGAPADQVAAALAQRARLRRGRGEEDAALADCRRLLDEVPDAPWRYQAQAFSALAVAACRRDEPALALADFDRALSRRDGLPTALLAEALSGRTVVLLALGWPAEALPDCDDLLALPALKATTRCQGLVNRALIRERLGDEAGALADADDAVGFAAGLGADLYARRLLERARLCTDTDRCDQAVADCDVVLAELAERAAPRDSLDYASVAGAVSWRHGELEPRDDQRPTLLARALVYRGTARLRLEQYEAGRADLDQVVDGLPDVPLELLAQALINRGWSWYQQGDQAAALADYARVLSRASDLSPRQVALTLNNRAACYYRTGEHDRYLAGCEEALTVCDLPLARANLGLALLVHARDDEALAAYAAALPGLGRHLAAVVREVEQARDTWLSAARAARVLAVLRRGVGTEPGGPERCDEKGS